MYENMAVEVRERQAGPVVIFPYAGENIDLVLAGRVEFSLLDYLVWNQSHLIASISMWGKGTRI